MKRGEIYWIKLDPTTGSEINKTRPCVIVGSSPVIKARKTVAIVPLSTKLKAFPPVTVPVHCLEEKATAICDQIRSVDRSRIGKFVGKMSAGDMTFIDTALRRTLDL